MLYAKTADLLGMHVVEMLQSAGYSVQAFVRRSFEAQTLPPFGEAAIADVRNVATLISTTAGCGAVVLPAAKVILLAARGAIRTSLRPSMSRG